MKAIHLTRGLVTLVDNQDFARFGHLKWYAQKSLNSFYAVRRTTKECILLHRLILDASGNAKVDHRNGVGLDNRRSNLRLASQSQNDANSWNKSNASGLKGVIAVPRNKKNPWRAEIKHHRKRYHLGYFATAEEAEAAHKKKAIEIYGEFARFQREPLDPVLRFLQGAGPSGV